VRFSAEISRKWGNIRYFNNIVIIICSSINNTLKTLILVYIIFILIIFNHSCALLYNINKVCWYRLRHHTYELPLMQNFQPACSCHPTNVILYRTFWCVHHTFIYYWNTFVAFNYQCILLESLAGSEIKYKLLLLSSTFTKGTITVKMSPYCSAPYCFTVNIVFAPIRKLHASAFEAKMRPSLSLCVSVLGIWWPRKEMAFSGCPTPHAVNTSLFSR
jgi:hypothetical protein